jgi:hypothetical protein
MKLFVRVTPIRPKVDMLRRAMPAIAIAGKAHEMLRKS